MTDFILTPQALASISARLEKIYGENLPEGFVSRLQERIANHYQSLSKKEFKAGWDEKDVALITYGDSLKSSKKKAALATLKKFADKHLQDTFNIIHLLPIFPYTSDDGFSVSDYRVIRSELGNWDDVECLGENFDLMFDFVMNHCSRVSLYFSDFRGNRDPYTDFFIYEDPDKDWSQVVRPRSTPLLTEIPTHEGIKHVWTTFSADQVDLNYKNPNVLLEMVDILLFYISQGSRITRLDAIAFLWKELGTSCLHLPQTHEIIKIMRDVVNDLVPGALLLTETNVPHEENISYFGEGDEAHLVYQFSLPPLLLHAIHTSNTVYLYDWLKHLSAPPEGCSYFNFTASHDGIGVRPLEGLIPDEELKLLLDDMRARGAYISTRQNTEGENIPYEINVTYYDAFRCPGQRSAPWQTARYLLSQTVALSLKGIPAVYMHSLLATPNDHSRVEVTGSTRAINRHQWDIDELKALLDAKESTTHLILNEYRKRIRTRREQSAFHPDAGQDILDLSEYLLGVVRISHDCSQRIVALYNFSLSKQFIPLDKLSTILGGVDSWYDLLSEERPTIKKKGLKLSPYACIWLTNK
ncbi:MAG: Putative sucrose phosphorylase (EC [uncultured Thiotrichaceae bacterium]|uniref:Sucrose phosphorylase (EC) n=1 Tax=uncultured Thiotrichaceae bacterium TaxID=298394 RepID=A0A6S6SRR0_9GAMM|nr:MAG: Putative sucrose phosphorylase (EC [uncultured Thiotrichaceae bacterium]